MHTLYKGSEKIQTSHHQIDSSSRYIYSHDVDESERKVEEEIDQNRSKAGNVGFMEEGTGHVAVREMG